jgi:hypothetical protein
MEVEKVFENQLESLVTLFALLFPHKNEKFTLKQLFELIHNKSGNGKSHFQQLKEEVNKSLEKHILAPLESLLVVGSSTDQVQESNSVVSEENKLSSVSSTTRVEKVPTPVKKTVTKKPPTPTKPVENVTNTNNLVQTTLVQAHPLMTGESLEKTTKKSKPSAVPENYTGPTCKYVFKRGELKGKECGKPTMTDSEYCDQCNNKKTNKPLETKDEKPKEKKTKTSETKPMVGFTTSVGKRATEKPKIELRETGQPNTYIDVQTNIVVKKVVDNDRTLFVAVGMQEESGFRTLNEEEKKEALNRNFTLLGSETRLSPKKIVAKQPVNSIPDIESDNE